MATKDPIDWMLSDAIGTLARAERLHQQFLKLRPMPGMREPSWEPPIDVLETDREVLILVALPGVDPEEDKKPLVDQIEGFRMGDKKNKRDDDLLDTFCYGIAISLGNSEGF